MAHYAFLDENNIVTEVIVGIDEAELIEGKDPEVWYGEFRGQACKRTSYNGNIRKNYAGIGFTYNADLDAFVPPKPFNSWVLNEETANWDAPVARPEGNPANIYIWDEEIINWTAVKPYESWTLNEETGLWEAPVARPEGEGNYIWNEENTEWTLVEPTE